VVDLQVVCAAVVVRRPVPVRWALRHGVRVGLGGDRVQRCGGRADRRDSAGGRELGDDRSSSPTSDGRDLAPLPHRVIDTLDGGMRCGGVPDAREQAGAAEGNGRCGEQRQDRVPRFADARRVLRAARVAVAEMDSQRQRKRSGLPPAQHIDAASLAERSGPRDLRGEAAESDR
jgi:hypothetical protein